jgi:hypothetical protein
MPSDEDAEREAIVTAVARGRTVREVSREFERAEAEVRSIVADAVKRAYDGEWLRQEWALEDHRLKQICLKNFAKAMDGEGDSTAAAVYIKASERRATLAGANAPQAYSVHLSHDAAPEQHGPFGRACCRVAAQRVRRPDRGYRRERLRDIGAQLL